MGKGNFKNKMYQFLSGRYGTDTLNKVLWGCYIAVLLIGSVIFLFVHSIVYMLIYDALMIALVIVFFWRMFSRNIPKRRRENEKFCGFFRLRKNKFRDRKTHVYRKCPHCHAVLRLPKAKGKHPVSCPRCGTRFEVKG